MFSYLSGSFQLQQNNKKDSGQNFNSVSLASLQLIKSYWISKLWSNILENKSNRSYRISSIELLYNFYFTYFHCYCKTTWSVSITKSFSLFSDKSATSPTRHKLSISRKPLIAAKATRIDSFTVKSQLIDPLNNAVVQCTEPIMGPLSVNHNSLSLRAEKNLKLILAFTGKSSTFLLNIFLCAATQKYILDTF